MHFIKGMWNTPGMIAFREEWKQDRSYRIFIKSLVLTLFIMLAGFGFYG